MSNSSFIDSINSLSLPPSPLKLYTSRNSFPEFYSSAFPVFSLDLFVAESDLTSAIDQINSQACSELSFSHEEMEEMGFVAALPTPWALHDKELEEAVRWYAESFDKVAPAAEGAEDPRFDPLGFIGIGSVQWQEKHVGVVLIYLDVTGQRTDDESVTVMAFRLDPEKIGAAVISLRQGDDDIETMFVAIMASNNTAFDTCEREP